MNNPPSTAAANHIPSSLRLVTIARLAEILAELQRETPGVLSATLASADGLTVASTLSNNHEADKLSAMSGSLSALAGAMTREAGHGVQAFGQRFFALQNLRRRLAFDEEEAAAAGETGQGADLFFLRNERRRTVDQLADVNGIGPATLEANRDMIIVKIGRAHV